MGRTIANVAIGNQVFLKDERFHTGTLVGIMKRENLPDQYLIGYKAGEPRHYDSWENKNKKFPNWVVCRDIRSFAYFIIVGGKLELKADKEEIIITPPIEEELEEEIKNEAQTGS